MLPEIGACSSRWCHGLAAILRPICARSPGSASHRSSSTPKCFPTRVRAAVYRDLGWPAKFTRSMGRTSMSCAPRRRYNRAISVPTDPPAIGLPIWSRRTAGIVASRLERQFAHGGGVVMPSQPTLTTRIMRPELCVVLFRGGLGSRGKTWAPNTPRGTACVASRLHGRSRGRLWFMHPPTGIMSRVDAQPESVPPAVRCIAPERAAVLPSRQRRDPMIQRGSNARVRVCDLDPEQLHRRQVSVGCGSAIDHEGQRHPDGPACCGNVSSIPHTAVRRRELGSVTEFVSGSPCLVYDLASGRAAVHTSTSAVKRRFRYRWSAPQVRGWPGRPMIPGGDTERQHSL